LKSENNIPTTPIHTLLSEPSLSMSRLDAIRIDLMVALFATMMHKP
jgi:hypothetical protein